MLQWIFGVHEVGVDLDAGRLVRRVGVLLGAEQEDVPEVLHALKFGDAVEAGFLGVGVVGHGQLFEAVAVLELLQHPDACLDDRRGVDFVSEMRGGEGDEGVELVLHVQQARQCSSDDHSSQTVPNERDVMQRIRWEELVDVIPDLNSKAIAHFYDVGVRHVLVGAGAQEGDLGIHEGKVVLDELHVQRVALETVHKDSQVQRDPERALGFTLSSLRFL